MRMRPWMRLGRRVPPSQNEIEQRDQCVCAAATSDRGGRGARRGTVLLRKKINLCVSHVRRRTVMWMQESRAAKAKRPDLGSGRLLQTLLQSIAISWDGTDGDWGRGDIREDRRAR